MSLPFLQFYVSANALLMVAYALFMSAKVAGSRLGRPLSHHQQLYFIYGLIAFSMAAPLVAAAFTQKPFYFAPAQVWSAPSFSTPGTQPTGASGATISFAAGGAQLPIDRVTQLLTAICLTGMAICLTRVFFGAASARRIIANSHVIRRCGSLVIHASAGPCVPFSIWMPGRSFIVVPAALIARPRDLSIAIRHEGQHHRHGDTRLLFVAEVLKGLFILNPALHLLCRQVQELQEFVCDAAVVGQRGNNARSYCDCLLWVAENTLARPLPGPCVPMAKFQTTLGRRIEALLQNPLRPMHAPVGVALQAAAIAILLALGVLLAGSVQDRRVTASQAQEWANDARRDTSFPIVVNPQVIAELNRLLGTPDGRAFLREGLARMQPVRAIVQQKLRLSGLPGELLAVPLIESGYRNRAPDGNERHGAGMWMFIRETAQAFGLRIDAAHDDRLNLASETDAATQLLSLLHAHFGDWRLALLAYNAGSAAVDRAISESGTRDAFRLAQLGYENDPHYLALVTATIIVMNNRQQP
jgi:membrane-bound lytic murein transglycosylase D